MLEQTVRVSKNFYRPYRSAAILHLCKLKKLPKVAAWATKLNLSVDPRAVDNALTLFRVWAVVWPSKNVGAILGHANAAAYA